MKLPPNDVISGGMIDTLQGIASRKDFFWKAQPLVGLVLLDDPSRELGS